MDRRKKEEKEKLDALKSAVKVTVNQGKTLEHNIIHSPQGYVQQSVELQQITDLQFDMQHVKN